MEAEFEIQGVSTALKHIIDRVSEIVEKYALSHNFGFDQASLNVAYSLVPTGITNIEKLPELRGIFSSWSNFNPHSHIMTQEVSASLQALRTLAVEGINLIEGLQNYNKPITPQRIYIPTLRGLRPLEDKHSDLYQTITVSNYFTDLVAADTRQADISVPEIFTGLSLYQRLIDLLLGKNSERKLIHEYQKFISETLFENKPVALIPSPTEKVVVVKIGNEQEQPIHHLGDGIQSAVILSFLPFVTTEEAFFFIEEPEMFMHPGLQRKILNFYSSLKRHRFFMTTHSNHFLDITIDIKNVSVFTFKKLLDSSEDDLTPSFVIERVDKGDESSLELLGVRNSSVFLVNATIWVEGITDRWYLRRMLNSYMDFLNKDKQSETIFEEDTHYSFVEYGGANITHWSFLDKEEHPIEVERLCAKAILIIDKDGESKEERKEALEKLLGDRLIIVPGREIENLLPYEVIKKVVSSYEKRDDLTFPDIDIETFKDEYLGGVIEETLLDKNIARKGGYKADSGTIKNKVDFCERALSHINYEDLSGPVQEIINRIYEFIRERNS